MNSNHFGGGAGATAARPAITLTSPDGGRAEIRLHGGHVTRWTDASGSEVIYLSPRARFDAGAAIRGGVPIIFPQFADLGPLPKHGFARTAEWEVVEQDASRTVLRLTDTPATHAVWDQAFEADLRVELTDGALEMSLAVCNTGERAFEFTCALHTYFRVGDVRRASVLGLDGVRYEDKVAGGEEVQSGDLRLAGETDRVYFAAPDELRIRDEAEGRTIVLTKRGFPDAVVWNPWAEKAGEMDDLGGDQWPFFVCVEAACVGRPVRLEPGARWEGGQRIRVER
jgi:glucose-6-phosphate 1-epimerase